MKLKAYLSGKLHQIRVTDAQVNYVGSVAIDRNFLKAAGIAMNEQVEVVNLTTPGRWWTYVIPAPAGSRTMSLNGGGAHLGKPGDVLIVMSYAWSDDPVTPVCVFFGEGNEVVEVGTTEEHPRMSPGSREA